VTGPDDVVPVPITFTVPAGWYSTWAIEKVDTDATTTGDQHVDITFGTVTDSYRDPCRWSTTAIDPQLGPTVQDLVDALGAQVGRNTTRGTPVTLDGHAGQRLGFDWPADIDPATCDFGEYRAWTAGGGSPPQDASRANTMGRHSVVWIVDVDGLRVVVEAVQPIGISAAVEAEVQAIVDSIRFGQPSSGPTPVPSP
jgi:hypothetical protein